MYMVSHVGHLMRHGTVAAHVCGLINDEKMRELWL